MDNTQPNLNTSDHKPSTEELIQQATTVRKPTPVRPVSQLAPAMHHTVVPIGRQMRSRSPTDITSLFNQPSPPDTIQRKPVTPVNPVNTFMPIAPDTPSQEDIEVASIMGSTRLYEHSSGMGSGVPSRSGLQSEHSAFSAYLRDSRIQPSELFIPDGSGDTLTSRTNARYGNLNNGHEASVVKIESFILYFDSDRYVINHHNGDIYLWDRESNNLEPLALQAGTAPLSADAVKMLAQTTTNTHWLTLQNRPQSCSSSRSSSRASSRASARTHSHNSCYGTPQDPFWVNVEDLTLEATLHISINPSSMDGPADEEVFESNHLGEIADIRSKLIWNLAKIGKTYHHICAQLLNPTLEELSHFIVNWERDFNSCLHHILHLDNLLARDARHYIQLGYPVLNYPRYIPTMVELCRSSFTDIIDKLKADLAYFKDDFQNADMLKATPRPTGNKRRPGPGHEASTPNPLETSMGCSGSTTARRNPPPWVTPVPSPRTTLCPTTKEHPSSSTKEYPCWIMQKHSHAINMTSAPAEKNYTIQSEFSKPYQPQPQPQPQLQPQPQPQPAPVPNSDDEQSW